MFPRKSKEMDGVNKNFRDCVKYALLSPLKAVKFLAKAAWRISKKAFRFIRGKKETSTSTVSDLQITGSTERMVDSCFDRSAHVRSEGLNLERFRPGLPRVSAGAGQRGRLFSFWHGFSQRRLGERAERACRRRSMIVQAYMGTMGSGPACHGHSC